MKKYFKIFLMSFALVSFYACEKDDDLTPEEAQERLIGVWNCEENSQITGTTNFEVHISAGTDVTQVLIENFSFLGFGNQTYATINGSTITIPHQVVAGHTVEGGGALVGDKTFDLDYSVDDGSGPDQISAFFTKK